MILDSNAISALSKANPEVIKILRSSKKHSLPVIVIGEVQFGLMRSTKRKELTSWVNELKKEMEVLTVDCETADAYAEVKEELRAAGRPIPENDVWIAALARQHGLSVLSRDAHFDYVAGLIRIGW